MDPKKKDPKKYDGSRYGTPSSSADLASVLAPLNPRASAPAPTPVPKPPMDKATRDRLVAVFNDGTTPQLPPYSTSAPRRESEQPAGANAGKPPGLPPVVKAAKELPTVRDVVSGKGQKTPPPESSQPKSYYTGDPLKRDSSGIIPAIWSMGGALVEVAADAKKQITDKLTSDPEKRTVVVNKNKDKLNNPQEALRGWADWYNNQ